MSRIVLLICLWCTFLAHAQTWNTSGNAGTNSAINFIGTTDSQSLVMKTNNSERNIPAGNYLLNIEIENKMVTKKFIKQ